MPRNDHFWHETLPSVLRSRDKYHMVAVLLSDMLADLGYDASFVMNASKDQVAHLLIAYEGGNKQLLELLKVRTLTTE